MSFRAGVAEVGTTVAMAVRTSNRKHPAATLMAPMRGSCTAKRKHRTMMNVPSDSPQKRPMS